VSYTFQNYDVVFFSAPFTIYLLFNNLKLRHFKINTLDIFLTNVTYDVGKNSISGYKKGVAL